MKWYQIYWLHTHICTQDKRHIFIWQQRYFDWTLNTKTMAVDHSEWRVWSMPQIMHVKDLCWRFWKRKGWCRFKRLNFSSLTIISQKSLFGCFRTKPYTKFLIILIIVHFVLYLNMHGIYSNGRKATNNKQSMWTNILISLIVIYCSDLVLLESLLCNFFMYLFSKH